MFATCDQIMAGIIPCCCIMIIPKLCIHLHSVLLKMASSGPALVDFLYYFYENNRCNKKNNR